MSTILAPAPSLAALIGEWRIAMSTWSEAGEPTRSDAVIASNTWFADGRYVKEIVTGEFAGGHHQKLTLLGYNQTRSRFEYVTADNHDGVLLLHTSRPGTDVASGHVEFLAEYAAPHEGDERPAEFVVIRTELLIESAQHHVLRNFYRPGSRPERLFLEYVYTRRN